MSSTTKEFLQKIRGNAGQGFFTLCSMRAGEQSLATHWFDITAGIDKAAEKAVQLDAQGQDVYVSTCMSKAAKTTGKRQSKTDISTVTAFFGDFDTLADPEKVKKGANLPLNPSVLNEALSVCAFPPSVCVNSGHGVHAWWLLSEPIYIADEEQRKNVGNQLRSFIEAIAQALGGYEFDTHASELARILRVPGTNNHKRGECLPVNIMPGATWKRYPLEELEAFSKQHAPNIKEQAPAIIRSNIPGLPSDIIEIIEKARQSKNGELFSALFDRGEISRYGNDDSRADEALCGMLAFWFNKDAQKMDEAFRASAIYRPEKWDKKDGAGTYGDRTIKKAIDTLNGSGYQPKQKKNAAVMRPRITIEALEEEITVRGYSLHLNDITREMDVKTSDGSYMTYKNLRNRMHSELSNFYKGIGFDTLDAYFDDIAERYNYNPVLEHVNALVWDTKDHLSELFDLMGITHDKLSCVLVRKWLLQGYALLHNDRRAPFGAEGVLTLRGIQHAGKTSLFRRLALRPEWFLEGASIDTRDKDTLRRACTRWIVELGEVESTMKSDVERLKAFITSAEDVYRVPYGRMDEKHPRRTNLCATCNSDRYLIDTTGNRRWFTVPVEKVMPYAEIMQLDVEQIWAQITHIACYSDEDSRRWRLTEDELTALNERNGESQKLGKGEAEVIDILAEAVNSSGYVWEKLTVSVWKELYPSLRNYSTDQVAKALSAQGYKAERTSRVNGRPGRYIELPRPVSSAIPHLKYHK